MTTDKSLRSTKFQNSKFYYLIHFSFQVAFCLNERPNFNYCQILAKIYSSFPFSITCYYYHLKYVQIHFYLLLNLNLFQNYCFNSFYSVFFLIILHFFFQYYFMPLFQQLILFLFSPLESHYLTKFNIYCLYFACFQYFDSLF